MTKTKTFVINIEICSSRSKNKKKQKDLNKDYVSLDSDQSYICTNMQQKNINKNIYYRFLMEKIKKFQ